MDSLNPNVGQSFHTFVSYYENPQTTPEIQNFQKMICDTSV